MKKYSLLILCFIFVLFGCRLDRHKEEILILNESDSIVYIYWSYTDSITNERPLKLFEVQRKNKEPFIVHGRVKDSLTIIPSYRMDPYLNARIETLGNEEFFNQSFDKKVRIFYISEQTMRTKTWNEIVKDQLYFRKDVYSVEDLKPFYWTIEYVPVL